MFKCLLSDLIMLRSAFVVVVFTVIVITFVVFDSGK